MIRLVSLKDLCVGTKPTYKLVRVLDVRRTCPVVSFFERDVAPSEIRMGAIVNEDSPIRIVDIDRYLTMNFIAM